ncbi:MAG: endonuclease domain-containing protein [Thermoanaerobaculia bacterium]|nr:endonuclease domain-containing protein [Thermoanaerobaculia bacterium]
MSAARFEPGRVRRFRFLGYGFDFETATARLEYGFDDTHRFREELVFPGPPGPFDAAGRAALDRCLRYLHLAAGVSYFKAAAPPEISVETGAVAAAEAEFFGELYRRGLAEFAYRNRLPALLDGIVFPSSSAAEPPPPPPVELPRVTAVPIGGGKDSVVTLEALAGAGEPLVAVAVGGYRPIRRTAETAGRELRVVERRICPRLLELNRRGALNGHVPVSAVIAFTLAAAAPLLGFDAAALSNERSADAPDLVFAGHPVNHEFSKSLRFEAAADRLISAGALPGFSYFSLLRPFSELSIAGLFARHRAYHAVFRSCNAAYRLAPRERAGAWCGDCPKCRFVFLALTPFLGPAELTAIFGARLLDDEAQLPGYRRLAGLEGHRPLECVGDEEESSAALLLAAARPEWRDDLVVRRLAPPVRERSGDPQDLVRRVLTPSSEHRIPRRHAEVVGRLLSTALDDRDRLLALLERRVGA